MKFQKVSSSLLQMFCPTQVISRLQLELKFKEILRRQSLVESFLLYKCDCKALEAESFCQ